MTTPQTYASLDELLRFLGLGTSILRDPTSVELSALLPAVLDKVFQGEW